MPQSLTILKVLVSSPNDLAEEREIVAEAIEELNALWRKGANFELKLLRWETDARPGLGSDAQEVINRQVGDDYDVFLGIMGARFGTPTGRAASGTEEEFERAKARYEADPSSVSVMFYFKDAPPASLTEIDPAQLSKVQHFQRKLKSMGLITMFKTRDEFARLMRMHLSQEAQEWMKRLEIKQPVEVPNIGATARPEMPATADEEEEGYLDLLEQGLSGMEEVARTINRIGAAVNDIGNRATEQTAAMERAKGEAVGADAVKTFKRVANQMADYMSDFVNRLESEIPIYGGGFKRAIDPYLRALAITEITGETPEQVATVIASVEMLIRNHEHAIQTYCDLRQTISNTPRITTAYNRAKRRTVAALTALVEEFEKSLRLTRELHDVLLNRRTAMPNSGG